ncbi:LITAF domain-containing protein-like isoform X2 [Ornithodoros turicata]
MDVGYKQGPPPAYQEPRPVYQEAPPPYQPTAPPPAGFAPPPPQPAVPRIVVLSQWGPYPVQATCPNCGATVLTSTSSTPGLLTWLLSGALVLLGCWFGCCLVPCCVAECQDVEHHCPSCKRHLATFRRL